MGEVYRASADGLVKILDFGLAKVSPASDPAGASTPTVTQTRAGMILGTVGYMAPEQVRGLPTDHRADVWRLRSELW